jgi:diamine N-acetyltransferase
MTGILLPPRRDEMLAWPRSRPRPERCRRGAAVAAKQGREYPSYNPRMHNIHIRRGVLSDAAALAELAARTFADTFSADNKPEDLQAHLASAYGVPQQSAELADADGVTLLAERDGKLIGYAQVRRHAPPPCVTQDQPIELRRLYIDRSAHGTGVAGVLMSAAHNAARELGGKHLWLGVWERNARAIAFYTKVGFKQVGSHVFQVGSDPQTDEVFVAVLNDSPAQPRHQ